MSRVLLVISYVLFHGSYLAAHASASFVKKVAVEKEVGAALLEKIEGTVDNAFHKKRLDQIKDEGVKAIESTLTVDDGDDRVNFAFARLLELSNAQQKVLFLGASDVGANKASFSVAKALIDGTTTPASLAITGLAAGALNGARITNFSLFSSLMGMVSPIVTADGSPYIFMINNINTGENPVQSAQPRDAAGNDTDRAPRAIAGYNTRLFAAVSGNGSEFDTQLPAAEGADNRGIAVFTVAPNFSSIALDANNQNAQRILRAASVNTAPANTKHVAFSQDGVVNSNPHAFFGNDVSLYWHAGLGRLYIGLVNVKRSDDTLPGGIMALLMGRFDDAGVLQIEPVLYNLNRDHLYNNTAGSDLKNLDNTIVGFYSDGVTAVPAAANNGIDPLELSTHRIDCMHTSTGRRYLIVQTAARPVLEGKINTLPNHRIVALPLLGAQTAAGNAVPVEQQGTIATKNFSGPVTQLAQMPRIGQADVTVGGIEGDTPLEIAPDIVSDLFVMGDSVYLCLKGNNSDTVGMFQSTALFNDEGNIAGWTPWMRVAGSAERMFAGARSRITGDYFFIGETNAFNHRSNPPPVVTDGNKVKASQWGKSDIVEQSPVNNLTSLLEQIFPQAAGGVYQIHDFDAFTPSFLNDATINSMTVVLGKGKVALIKTSQYDPVTMNYYPTQVFNATPGPNQNVFVFENQALQDIGPLCAAAVSYYNQIGVPKGYLFVGGHKGVAVLSDNAGNGFPLPFNGLTSGGYPGTGFTFKPLVLAGGESLDSVRALRAVGNGMVIATRKNLHTVAIDTNLFTGVAVPSTAAYPNTAGTVSDFLVPWNGEFGPGNQNLLLLATTKGLFASQDSGAHWSEISIGGQMGLPVLQLAYHSNRFGFPGNLGTIYALVADRAKVPSEGRVYRLAVDLAQPTLAQKVTTIQATNDDTGVYIDFTTFRSNIFTDGSLIFGK